MFWIIAFLVFLVIEIFSYSLVSVWFCVGSLAAYVSTLFHANFTVQLIVFILVSVIMLVALRPLLKNKLTPRKLKTPVEALVGEECLVTESIDNLKERGEIRVNGVRWSARSVDGVQIEKDARVRICEVRGVKVLVEPVGAEAAK